MTSSTERASGISRVLVGAFIAIQIAVPAALLGYRWVAEGSQPVSEIPFSWQMYSAAPAGEYVGLTADGEEVPLSLEGLPPVVSAVGYDDSIPSALCELHPEMVEVQRHAAGAAWESFEGAVRC